MKRHEIECDLLVAGGGMAGVCAALSAARNGLRVVLVQDRSVLGGNASSEIRMHIVGADQHGRRKGWRESGLIEELRLEDAVRNPERCYPYWDLLLYEKVTAEKNITLLLDTDVVSAEVEVLGGDAASLRDRPARTLRMYEYRGPRRARINSARAVRHSTQDDFTIRARFYADCTGDGRLGYEAGADFRIGRESKGMHGESLAQEQDDVQTLGSSILLTTRNLDRPAPFVAPAWARKFTGDELAHGRKIHSWDYGFWWVEWGGQLDSIADHATTIRHELYRIALGLWDYIKNSGKFPASANATLDWIGAIPGKRESRRFLGPHLLTQQDVEQARRFEDEVAYGGWAIDLHPPSGVDAVDEPPYVPHPVSTVYPIPFRCYFSRNVENLLFAGRNISATHVAFASTRVMATCAVGGQAVGTAAAVCARRGLTPASLVADRAALQELQQTLLRDDAHLLHTLPVGNALGGASVRASSEQSPHHATLVLDGRRRDRLDVTSGAVVEAHSWRSRPLDGSSAWIELALPSPTRISAVHLTFDTGFQRQLMLTPSSGMTTKQVRGPQPECVADYRVEVDGRTVAEVAGNDQRKRVHLLDSPVECRTIRLVVTRTHGVPEARLFEVFAESANAR